MMSSQVTPPTEWSSAGEWASAYRAYGMAVIPSTVSSDGQKKHPLGSWKDFQDAGIPQAVHDRWYAPKGSHQFANTMGTLTGRACFGPDFSLLVIDVDVKGGKRGLETWRGWLDVHNNGIDIETWTVRTGSGGLHLYFRYPRSSSIRNTQEKVEGIDVRAEGGFVVMPPSPHYLPGKEYEWVNGCAPWETDIADAPTWLIEEAQSLSDLSLARTDRITQTEQPDSCEDVFGNTIDGRDKKMADVAYAAMLDAYRMCPIKPGLADLETIVQRAFSAYLAHTETRLPKDGRSKEERLDAEGRGLKAFREKIARHYRGWDSYLAEAARKAPRTVLERKIEEARVGETDALTIVHSLGDWMTEDGSTDHQWFFERCAAAGLASEHTDPETGEIGFRWVENYEPPKTTVLVPVPQGPIPTVSFKTLYTEEVVEEPDYIENGFAGPGNFVLIAGPPKAQKSFLLQEMLVACAVGRPFLCDTFSVPRPLRVFYLQAEMNRKLLRKRAKAMGFFSPEEIDRLEANFVLSERFHMILDENGVQKAVETIKASFPHEPPDIIAIDPLANLFDQESENDNAQLMRFLTQRVERVRQLINPTACVVMVHHATKAKQEDMARDPFACIRGAGALRGYYDSAIVIYRKNEETKTRRIHFELRSGESPEPIEAELTEGLFKRAGNALTVSREVCKAVLSEMRKAWERGEPWSPHDRARGEGRHAQSIMMSKFDVPKHVAEALIQAWAENQIITWRERVYRRHPAGFEVTGSLD